MHNPVIHLPMSKPGRYLEMTLPGQWMLCDPTGPIRALNSYENGWINAAYATQAETLAARSRAGMHAERAYNAEKKAADCWAALVEAKAKIRELEGALSKERGDKLPQSNEAMAE